MGLSAVFPATKNYIEVNANGTWEWLENNTGSDVAAGDLVKVSTLSGTNPKQLAAVADDTTTQIPGIVDHMMLSKWSDYTPAGSIKKDAFGWVKTKGPVTADTKAALNPTLGHGAKIHDGVIDTLGAASDLSDTHEIGVFQDTGAASVHKIILHGLGPKVATT